LCPQGGGAAVVQGLSGGARGAMDRQGRTGQKYLETQTLLPNYSSRAHVFSSD